ncbi:GGDEF domain-containing protein [bacterium endosymbiont of Escarpia laminata]|nr:MAG: GGDEF domain-containing protein [bacterium endosymbiont of Escarpia laminata]
MAVLKKVSTIQVIDSLAEITRFHDRDLIERSLVKTLAEVVPCKELRLYRVTGEAESLDLLLLAHLVENKEVSGIPAIERHISKALSEGIAAAVGEGEVVSLDDDRRGITDTIYPVFNTRNEVFAVLVQFTEISSFELQRLTYGLLKVYSNYLTLLDENQKDKLTGLLNRETLSTEVMKQLTLSCHKRKSARSEVNRRSEDEATYWLALIDVDYFKKINDRFGHLFGDEVLILLARLLTDTFRDGDLLFRYGGEEFVVILKVFSQKDAVSVLERCLRTVGSHEMPQAGRVTISIGAVEIRDQNGTADVIGSADRALYYAKNNGRNQLHFYEDLIENNLLENAGQPQIGEIDIF